MQHLSDDVWKRMEDVLAQYRLSEEHPPHEQFARTPVSHPSGCVGAYCHALHQAREQIQHCVKQTRCRRFQSLPHVQQEQITLEILEACTRDDHVDFLPQLLSTYDVDAFGVGPDGTRTCALHAAAFSNAPRVIEYLCRGIQSAEVDGGLCWVNIPDDNGWTALHFAAGANHVEAIEALVRNHADTETEATNGYTPLQWAERLQNDDAALALRRLTGQERQGHHPMLTRFLSLIPTAS